MRRKSKYPPEVTVVRAIPNTVFDVARFAGSAWATIGRDGTAVVSQPTTQTAQRRPLEK